MGADQRPRALPLIVDGGRVGTVLIPADTDESVLDALENRVVPALETLLAAARRRDELEAQVIETQGAAPRERRQDDAAALGVARPALAADGDRHGRRRAGVRDDLGRAATRAGLGDHRRRQRGSSAWCATCSTSLGSRPAAPSRAPTGRGRRAGAVRGRLGGRPAGRFRPRPRPDLPLAARRRRSARARAGQRAGELRPLRGCASR